jgi:mycothiol system anti-sigma-R factor
MSCGSPHEVDCSEVLDQVYLYLDHEMPAPGEYDKVRHHLDECSPCLRQFGLEQAVKAVVHRCCGGENAPEALRVQVLARIRQVRVDIDRSTE